MSLRTRLILSYVLIIVISLGTAASVLLVLLQDYRDKQVMARMDSMSRPIYVQVRALAQGRASLNQVWVNLKEQSRETGAYIFLIDEQSNVLRQVSPRGGSEHLTKLPLEELPAEVTKPYRGTYDMPDGETFLFVAYSLEGLFRYGGSTAPEFLVLAMPRKEALALWAGFTIPFIWAGLVALGVSIIIAALLARSVYLPISRLTDAAREIAQGQYEQEVPVAGPSEVKGLALRFNMMAIQVKHSQQMLRDFVANASHELRSPLTSIKGFAQAITDGTAKDEEAQLRAARVIEDESKRLMRLVDDLLELSRLESGQIRMVREPVDVKELVEQCQEIFSMRAEQKSLRLGIDIEPVLPVIGDIDRLEQVFSNLIDNALRHTPSQGKVDIIVRQPTAGFIDVTVADTGPGIPPDKLAHIFERFYRADTSAAKTGTGLGLAIVREIVRSHGGDIKASSVPGKGTEFLVRLPANPYVLPSS